MKKSMSIVTVAFLLFSAFTILLSVDTCSATGNTIYVNASGGANYTTIQEAIDAAEPGDEVFVYSGDYHENLVITKDIILTGQSKDDTIIDGSLNGHVVYVHGSDGSEIDIQISGFTIRNAGGTGKDCIALDYVNDGTINDNRVMNSEDSDGIQLSHCSGITISGNAINSNLEGNGINLVASANNIINDNQIENNQKGIYLSSVSNTNIIYDNTINGNSLYGAHIIQSSNNRLYLNDFSNNGQNAQDSSTNSWSYNQQGNYWDDYTGEDANEDGIGDTPYSITGGSNQDLYPLGYFTGVEPPVNQKPVAHIDSVSASTATYGQTISFSGHGTDDGTITGYNWRSSINGQINTSSTFSKSDLSIGQHTIYFKVMDNQGEWSDETSTYVTITQNQKPTAYILKPTGTAIYGTAVEFYGYGNDPGGQIVAYSWRSIPSGIISNENSFTLSNLPVDEYTIYLKVRDNYGDWSEEVSTMLIVIADPSQPNEPPHANAGGPYSGYVNEEVTFNGAASYDSDTGDSITYNWNFGDNQTGEGVSPKHNYSSAGKYTIELTVIDTHGEQSKSTTYATIMTRGSGQNQDGNGSGDSVIPGFELNFLIVAIGIILLLRKYKNN